MLNKFVYIIIITLITWLSILQGAFLENIPVNLQQPDGTILHCLVTELRWTTKRKKKQYTNNGEVSFTEVDFKKRFNCCSATYLKARNQLIEVGIAKITYRGGMGRGICQDIEY